MSLKDLLPDGTYDEIIAETKGNISKKTKCPYCKKEVVYDTKNPYRPFCSNRCKLLDLGLWADNGIVVKGKNINEDEDADLLNDPNLPKSNL